MEITENVIEFLSNQRTATVTFSNQKHINKIKKIYAECGDEFKYFKENKDGTVCAKIPLRWIKVNPGSKPDPNKPKREISEEQKKKMRAALAEYRAKNKK